MNGSAPTQRISLEQALDGRRLGAIDIKITALLILAMMIDGYDVFVVGAILPFLAQDMGVAAPSLTRVFVAQQFGLFIGTFIIGPVSDRYGRRATLLACVSAFSLLTLLTVLVSTPTELLAVRFVSSLFFAGIIPNAVALSSEMTPRRVRAGLVSVVMCGFTAGHFIEAFVQAFLLEPFGWRSAFWTGGLLGLAVLVILFLFLPESIRFRARRDPHDPRVQAELARLAPGVTVDAAEAALGHVATDRTAGSIAQLFRSPLALPTILLWWAFLCSFIVNHLVGSWNTTVLHGIGDVSMQRIALGATIGTVAGIAGTIASGFLMDRFGLTRMLALFMLCAALSVTLFGLIDLNGPMFFVVSALSAYFINSVLGGINSLTAIVYPSAIRGTGLAWAAGAGRAGGMIGPALGGAMLAQGWSLGALYLVTGLPLLASAIAVMLAGARRVPTDKG